MYEYGHVRALVCIHVIMNDDETKIRHKYLCKRIRTQMNEQNLCIACAVSLIDLTIYYSMFSGNSNLKKYLIKLQQTNYYVIKEVKNIILLHLYFL